MSNIEYRRNYYKNNKEKYQAYNRKWARNNPEKMKKIRENGNKKERTYRHFITSLLARFKVIKGCVKCGYNKCSFALHFDHIDKSNKHNERHNKAIEPRWSKDRIKKELKKCQILCATCHAEKTVLNNDNHTQMINVKWRNTNKFN